MNELYLRELTLDDEQEVLNFIKEIDTLEDEFKFEGMSKFKNITSYSQFLDELSSKKNYEVVYVLCEKNKIYALVSIRKYLDETTISYRGNIGYSVLPSKRKMGYGTIALKLALKMAKELKVNNDSLYEDEVLLTCRKSNEASSKVIEKCNGTLDNIIYSDEMKDYFKRYFIRL